ncbi:hypothetical protein LOTGIDRAFT_237344 [Lottia gigantea]|uniref:Sushi domain-containing protein n=1 Tax=Lottia gigantea TaxID=225164 RepID=V4CPY6_LOTGI|nr:hypothetical protein LOTGIDRAFT_237344 [Lottia gigantea]ESP04500.1 hypothetical protein LOTGIDRAFT_237344 [Lottia gigantea]
MSTSTRNCQKCLVPVLRASQLSDDYISLKGNEIQAISRTSLRPIGIIVPTAGTCQVLDPVQNGIWKIEGFHPGSIATLTCNEGYTLIGSDVNTQKICKDDGDWVGEDNKCISNAEAAAIAQGGLPFLIIVITLVLCALLLATIVLVIVILVYRRRKQGVEDSSPGLEPKISFGALDKPLTGHAVEVQPELGNLEPRVVDQRAYFMQYGQLPPRRFLPMEPQRRLIPVPEEDGDAELTSPDGTHYVIDPSDIDMENSLQDWSQAYGPLIPPEPKSKNDCK